MSRLQPADLRFLSGFGRSSETVPSPRPRRPGAPRQVRPARLAGLNDFILLRRDIMCYHESRNSKPPSGVARLRGKPPRPPESETGAATL
eukprot:6157367-Prymnesium_polylepis.1